MPIEPLIFDSALCGFPVSRLHASSLSEEQIVETVQGFKHGRLLYAAVAWEDGGKRAALEACGGILVDRKTTFRKLLSPPVAPWPSQISPFAGNEPTAKLVSLALASGQYSRFRIDPTMPQGVFEKLYRIWIERSVRKEIADETLIADDESGLVTLKLSDSEVIIGLIAVAENYRGKGIGRRLMAAAEVWGTANGATQLSVVTQGTNAGACALYLRAGCSIAEEQAFYHIWLPSPG